VLCGYVYIYIYIYCCDSIFVNSRLFSKQKTNFGKFTNITYDDACIIYIGLQYIYHLSCYYIFTRNTHIKKKLLYIRTAMLSNSGILPILHIGASILTIFFPESCFIVGPILGLIFQFHWENHVSILKEINRYQLAILGVEINTN
jgi:hypothetical protein